MQNKRIKLITIILIILVSLVVYGETRVLILGAGDYKNDGIITLPAAIEDAERIKAAIIELEIAKEQNITYIKNPVLTDIKIGLKEFLKKGEETDLLIVYFSGHSEVETNTKGKKDTYLCGIDVRKNFIQETAYNFRENFEELGEAIKAKKTIMIFDTCYAGGLTKERRLSSIRIEKTAFEDIAASKGINFLFSSGSNETSQEIGEDRGGWYTYHLIEGLKGGANLDGDDYVTLNELSAFVQQKVSQSTQQKQNPVSLIQNGDIKLTIDETKKSEETLNRLTKAYLDGKLTTEHFQRYGKILAQNESEDTEEEKEIRTILLNYNTLPSLGIKYVKTMTSPYFEQQPICQFIRIETNPAYASIYINGQYMGISPYTAELKAGTYTLEVQKDGYRKKITTKTIGTQTKDLSRNETIRIELEKEETTGSVIISSDPMTANIYVDGTYKGTTPKTIEGLETGYHLVKLIKDHYEDKVQNVKIESGKTENMHLYMERIEEKKGSIFINSNPSGALIYLDGSYKGSTPKTIEDLEAGNYALKLLKETYNDKTQNIKIKAGERESVYVNLEKEETTGSIFISTNPSGAYINFNGGFKGNSPKTIENIEAGYYTLKISKEGYKDQIKSVEIEVGKQTSQHITLVQEEAKTGSVSVSTNPSSSYIYLDGIYQGFSPMTIEDLEPGYYSIKLKKSGYHDKTQSIGIEAGEKENLYTSLEKEKTTTESVSENNNTGRMIINSNPSGAYIYLNQGFKGACPKTLEDLEPGTYAVKATKNDYEDKIVNITLNAGETKQISLQLEKKNEENRYIPGKFVPDLVLVKGGTFQMGDTRGDAGIFDLAGGEKPVHTVKLTYDYYIGKTEVLFNEFDVYYQETGRWKKDDKGWGKENRPVIDITWFDAIGYCNWLSEKEGLMKAYGEGNILLDRNGNETTDITQVEGYRLPTEAEWEYAARGGHKDSGDTKYAGNNDIGTVGWYSGNSSSKTHEVKEKEPNELGLYDMNGNVKEWCYDFYGKYPSGTLTNPIGPESGNQRVVRGGSWDLSAGFSRLSSRCRGGSSYSGSNDKGFRIVRTKISF